MSQTQTVHFASSNRNAPVRPPAFQTAGLGSWTLGMSPLKEMAVGIFGGRIPGSDTEIRDHLVQLILTQPHAAPCPQSHESHRRVALRLLESNRAVSAEALSATAISSIRTSETEHFRIQSLGTLFTIHPDVAQRFCVTLTYCRDEMLQEFGIIGLEQNAPGLFFRRGYELALESATNPKLRTSLIQILNAMIGTRLGQEVPKLSAEVGILESLGPKVARLCGLSSLSRDVRRDAVLAARVLRVEPGTSPRKEFLRLNALNPELALVVAAARHIIIGKAGCEATRDLFRERAPVAANAVGLPHKPV